MVVVVGVGVASGYPQTELFCNEGGCGRCRVKWEGLQCHTVTMSKQEVTIFSVCVCVFFCVAFIVKSLSPPPPPPPFCSYPLSLSLPLMVKIAALLLAPPPSRKLLLVSWSSWVLLRTN